MRKPDKLGVKDHLTPPPDQFSRWIVLEIFTTFVGKKD